MSETGQGEAHVGEDQAMPGTEPAAGHQEGAEASGADTNEDIQRLEAEKADLTDRLIRVVADMDNLRRRTERDISDARRYAVSKFAGDILTVGDNLRRALEAVPADLGDNGDAALKALLDGVEMTARELERQLERHGVKRIEAQGARFDPHLHQAVFEVPDESVPSGTIVQVMQDGYTIGDRVLRAAMVGVSKGGPAQPNGAEANTDSTTA
jgi:molecular chaperone GrpE